MRKVLITGATGFIGSNLVNNLVQNKEYRIFITARESSDFWRIKEILPSLNINYTNLENRDEVFQLIETIRPNYIFHISTYGGSPNQQNQEQIIKSNLNATINLIDAAVIFDVEQFINTGSSSEYGIKDSPMKEKDYCEPTNLYGITKLAATQYCSMIAKTSNVRVCTLRLFSPYGPLEDSSRLYPSIVNALSNNVQPKLSRPYSVRDFIEIEKVIEIYKRIIDAPYISGEIINVGAGKQQTIAEFYESILRKLNKSHIEPIWGEAPPRANEPKRWEANITRLKTLIEIDL